MTFGFCKEGAGTVKHAATLTAVMLRVVLAAVLACLGITGAASAMLLRPADETPTLATSTTPPAPTTTAPLTTATTTAPATTATTTAPATTPSPPPVVAGRPSVTFLLAGHGWGHGVGLSQWGARGYAEHGWTADRILAHYYPGTVLAPAGVSSVRVLLVEGAKSLKLASTVPWKVLDVDGTEYDLPAGKLTLAPALKVTTAAGAETLEPPLTFESGGAPLQVSGKAYRGAIVVDRDAAKKKLQAVDVVGLEDYLKGVVPAEMPSTWPAEALKAQAVAARSYALAQRTPAKAFDLYADTRSQVYLGVATERPSTSAAIDASAGQVLTYAGKVATTYFSSSSGGRTAAAQESFGKPVPYLVSVADPYDASPYRDWTAAIDGAKAAKALGLKGTVTDIEPVLGPSGRVVTATLTLPTGQSIVAGSRLRSALGLRSTWFTLSLLSLTPPPAAVVYGSTATLEGVVRGVAAPVLEQRSGSVFWAPGGPLRLSGNGAFSAVVKPLRRTDYRLGAGTVRGGAARVNVAPAIKLGPTLRGTVKPVVAGKPVELQAQHGSAWKTVATATVAASGAFDGGALGSGTFRARYAPGAGLVAGASAPVVVP
jgi:stage II sporulation protein D